MRFGVRAFCDSMNIGIVSKFWCGQVVTHKNELNEQIFDLIPPADLSEEAETLELATLMADCITNELGYKAEIFEIRNN